MPRKIVGKPRDQQLLIRVTADELEVLESAAHLNRQTPASYSYALIQSHVASLRSDPFIARDLQNRHAFAESLASTIALPVRSQEPACEPGALSAAQRVTNKGSISTTP